MKNNKLISIINLLVLIGLIIWNYYSNTGEINGKTIAEVSDLYNNELTPASYAFGIWGLIYIALLAQAFYIISVAYSAGEADFIYKIVPHLIAANIGNFIWVWFWLHQQILVSAIVMTIILFSLLTIIFKLNMERWNAPLKTIAFIWWPIDLYAGWITVATVLNITSLFVSYDWLAGANETVWALILIAIITIIYSLTVKTRNMREFALVGCWALIAIAVRHWGTTPLIQWSALIGALVLFIITTIHAYKHRKTSPLKQLSH